MPRMVRKVAQEWEQGFTDTIPTEAGAAGSGKASVAAREFAAACLALEDSLTHDQPIVVLTDSKGLMTVALNWVGEGKVPLLREGQFGPLQHVY